MKIMVVVVEYYDDGGSGTEDDGGTGVMVTMFRIIIMKPSTMTSTIFEI
mgnify:CR=1 FL=1